MRSPDMVVVLEEGGVASSSEHPKMGQVMVVEVRTLDGSNVTLCVGPAATGLQLKRAVEKKFGIPCAEQHLVLEASSVPLADAAVATESGLADGSTLTCIREDDVIEVQLQTGAIKGADGAPKTFCKFHVTGSTPLDTFMQCMSRHRNAHVTGESVELSLDDTTKGIRKFKLNGDPKQPVGELLAKPVARISCASREFIARPQGRPYVHTYDEVSAADERLRRCIYT